MAESELIIKILPVSEGIRLAPAFPSLSYAEEFFAYREKIYGFKGGFLAAYKNNNLIFLAPLNYNGPACYSVYKDYAEPLIFPGFDSGLLFPIIDKLRREFGFKKVEFNFGFIKTPGALSGLKRSALSIFVLRLPERLSPEDLLGKFNKKTRNQIRKAQSRGFEIKIGPIERLDEIYELYLVNMKRHGTPAKPKIFFENLFKYFGNRCRQAAAYDNGRLAGANIMFIKDDYMRLQYNYSDPAYWPDCVNNLLYYKMIEWGRDRGVSLFDFGPGSDQDSSHGHFKLGYGAKPVPLYKMAKNDKINALKGWLSLKFHNLKIRFNKILKYGKH